MKLLSPAAVVRIYGHSRKFWMACIEAGELRATDERMPGAKKPRLGDQPLRRRGLAGESEGEAGSNGADAAQSRDENAGIACAAARGPTTEGGFKGSPQSVTKWLIRPLKYGFRSRRSLASSAFRPAPCSVSARHSSRTVARCSKAPDFGTGSRPSRRIRRQWLDAFIAEREALMLERLEARVPGPRRSGCAADVLWE
jgi:hypothetical protein